MYNMEKFVRPPFYILDFKFPAFFVIIVSSIMRPFRLMSYSIKAEFGTAAAHTLARSHGTKRETLERPDAAAGLLGVKRRTGGCWPAGSD